MKTFKLLKIPATIFLILVFFACSKSSVQQQSSLPPKLDQAQKDSIARMIAGAFVGKIPCADCEAINYTIMLSSTFNYSTKSVYLGKNVVPFENKGRWRMIGDSIIALENTSDVPSYLQIVNKDSLHMLDASMKRLTGPLISMFVLKRNDPDADTLNSTGILSSKYVLETLNDKKIIKSDYTNDIPNLIFAINKGAVSGSSGCNRLNGEIKITGKEISFLNLALTRMMCPGDGEANFLAALKSAKTFKAEGNKLYLMNGTITVAVFGIESK